MAGVEMSTTYRFSWPVARSLFSIRSLRLLFLQGFFGVFPWNVISFWFIAFLQTERGYDDTSLYLTMAVAVIVLAIGYPIGGALGDVLFKRTPRGRVIVSTIGVLTGAVLLLITLNVPAANHGLFLLMLALTALFIPFSSPNVVSTVSDVTLPEVRSTAISVQYFIESGGAALAPLLAGFIADRSSLGNAILLICISAWLICGAIYAFLILIVPKDIRTLREQMQDRADRERVLASEALPVSG
jgi:MFS family permease